MMTDDVAKTAGAVDHREPWLAGENSFSLSKDRQYIAGIMQYIRDNRVSLTLVDDGGGISHKSLLADTIDGCLQIDRPPEWSEALDPFRVFFRDMHQRWNFFRASSRSDNTSCLSVAMPETLYFLQRRSCNRVKVPVGTRALVKKENEAMATIFVYDLSAAGMLMGSDPAEGEYATDSIISDIVVSIPPGGSAGEVTVARKVLPLICRGRIVRSFVDQETQRLCYGVSFHYDSNYVKETISQVVSEVAGDLLLDASSSPN